MTNKITINELWHDSTGQYCAEIDIDGTRIASVYSPRVELLLVNALRDEHCEVWRSIRGRKATRVPGDSAWFPGTEAHTSLVGRSHRDGAAQL